MPYYAYHQTILGSDTTVGGDSTYHYHHAPTVGGSWSYIGDVFTHVVYEEGTGTHYNGDNDPADSGDQPNNERIRAEYRPGESGGAIHRN